MISGGCSFIVFNMMMMMVCFRNKQRPSRGMQIIKRIRMHTSLLSSHDDDYYYYMPPTLASVQKKDLQASSSSSSIKTSILMNGLVTSHLGRNPIHNTRHAPMVYHDRYSCPNWPTKHTFPMAKFKEMAVSLLNDSDEFLEMEEENIIINDNANHSNNDDDDIKKKSSSSKPLVVSPNDFFRPISATSFPQSFMSPPICSNFLQRFINGSLSEEECRIIGFREQTSRLELIERTVLEVAGTVLCAQLAIKYGIASNLAGGTHHATAKEGRGYTILNDLGVVARLMTWNGDDDNDNTDVEEIHDKDLLRKFYRGSTPIDRVLVVDVSKDLSFCCYLFISMYCT